MGEIEDEILEQTKGVAVAAYKDLVRPSAKPLGEILSLFPRTIRLAFSGWEKWLINREESLRQAAAAIEEKVMKIPEEKVVEPEAYVAIPAIQQLSYCQNSDELRELYANLLVSSMNTDTKWQVHPSFVDVIKQLNPDEAKFLRSFPANANLLVPLVDVEENIGVNSWIFLMTNFTNYNLELLEHPENICSYIDNLARLSLIEIYNRPITDEQRYKSLEEHPMILRFKSGIAQKIVRCVQKAFKLTNYGVNFVKVVCK